LSGGKKEAPPWMTPEDGDDVGQRVAAEAAEGRDEGGSSDDSRADEAPASGDGAGETPAGEPPVDLSLTVIELDAELQKTKERLLRTAADFENYRKRSQRDQEEARVRGREEVLRELLGAYDNLERAVEAAQAHAVETPVATALVDGVNMVRRQFLDGLGRFGVKQLESLGVPFDPTFHEAMAQQKSETYPPGTVLLEYKKGYMLGDRLLRPAMVIVASAESTGVAASTSGDAPAATDGAPGDSGSSGTEVSGGGEEGAA
jgi:molecular chaperone GrpE